MTTLNLQYDFILRGATRPVLSNRPAPMGNVLLSMETAVEKAKEMRRRGKDIRHRHGRWPTVDMKNWKL